MVDPAKGKHMSWLGTHPVLTKARARRLFPAACKRCRYFYRCFGELPIDCTRCTGRNDSNRCMKLVGIAREYMKKASAHDP